MTNIVFIDFETVDRYISASMGAGWAYPGGIDFICMAYATGNQDVKITRDLEEVRKVVSSADVLVAHNAQYELGVLSYYKIDYNHATIVDTMLLAKLHNNSHFSYGLNDLGKYYLNKSKSDEPMAIWYAQEIMGYDTPSPTIISRASKAVKGDMAAVEKHRPDLLEEYAIYDVVLCRDLYKYFVKSAEKHQLHILSDVLKAVVQARNKGVRIDVAQLVNLKSILAQKSTEILQNIKQKVENSKEIVQILKEIALSLELERQLAGKSIAERKTIRAMFDLQSDVILRDLDLFSDTNIEHILDKRDVFIRFVLALGAKVPDTAGRLHEKSKLLVNMYSSVPDNGLNIGVTASGMLSVTSDWLETNGDSEPVLKDIKLYRKYRTLSSNFVDKTIETILKIYKETDINNIKYAVIHPELNIMKASTGRFSSSNPNTQQWPKRDPEIGKQIRKIIVPFPGEKIYSLDFSSQEIRIIAHYAYKLGCKGSQELVDRYNKDKNLDLHQYVADLAGISRTQAKTINLGSAYGMGRAKLAQSLNIDAGEADDLFNAYHRSLPLMSELSKKCTAAMVEDGHIKTYMGRKLKREVNSNNGGFMGDYKAMNKLIQGSAADQGMLAIREIYRAGLTFLFPVHDEIVVSSDNIEDVMKIKHIMETCMPLVVPSVSEVSVGDNWGDQEEIG